MFVVLRNGKHFLETDCYQTACSEARKDALKHRMSSYKIWDKATLNKPALTDKDKPLYQVSYGISYNVVAT